MSVHKCLKACHKTEKHDDYLNRSMAGEMSVKAKTLKCFFLPFKLKTLLQFTPNLSLKRDRSGYTRGHIIKCVNIINYNVNLLYYMAALLVFQVNSHLNVEIYKMFVFSTNVSYDK